MNNAFESISLHTLNGFVSLVNYLGMDVKFFQTFQDTFAICENQDVLDGSIPLEHIGKIVIERRNP